MERQHQLGSPDCQFTTAVIPDPPSVTGTATNAREPSDVMSAANAPSKRIACLE
jgi:hypothetical protein